MSYQKELRTRLGMVTRLHLEERGLDFRKGAEHCGVTTNALFRVASPEYSSVRLETLMQVMEALEIRWTELDPPEKREAEGSLADIVAAVEGVVALSEDDQHLLQEIIRTFHRERAR